MSAISWSEISPLLAEQGYVLPDFQAAGAVCDARSHSVVGRADSVFELASVTKLLTSWAVLIGAAQGAYSLDSPVGGFEDFDVAVTLRHLLSHASGLPFEHGPGAVAPERRRVYSNLGIEKAAHFAAQQVEMPFDQWLRQSVFQPLGMQSSVLYASPAWGARSTVADLVRFAGELMRPSLLDEASAAEFRAVHFPELGGVVPGYGRFVPSPWGLGCQVRGANVHWLSQRQSADTFGHFGQSGSFVWVDPQASVGAVFLGERPFGGWHKDNWVKLNSAIGTLATE